MYESFTPPVPPVSDESLSGLALLRALRRDVVSIWPRDAYRNSSHALTIFGRRKIFLLSDPSSVRRVLVDDVENFPRSPLRNRLIKPAIGDGLVLAEGAEWRKQRKMLSPAFIPKGVDQLAGTMAAAAEARVATLARERQEIELPTTIARWTLEVVAKAMLSLEVGDKSRRLKEMSDFYLGRLAPPRMLDILAPPGFVTPHDLLRRYYGRRWMMFFEEVVDTLLKESERRDDLFELMRSALYDGANSPAFRRQLRDQTATMIAGANETTSLAIFWTLYLIAQAPHIQHDIRTEIQMRRAGDTIWPTGPVLNATFQESLRLFPPNFSIMRHVAQDTEIDGRETPKGSTLMILPWIIHRHEAYWRDPARFDISRFLPGAPSPEKYHYIPYSVGPRICIGAHFANSLAAQMISAFLSRYEISLAAPPETLPSCVALAWPDRKTYVKLTPL